MEAFGKRQSQDLVLCALHIARPSCQVTEGEMGMLKTGSDGDSERGWSFRGRSPSLGPMITEHLLFEKHYSEQDGQDPCPCEACGKDVK